MPTANVATLGIQVQTSGVTAADAALAAMAKAAKDATDAINKMTAASVANAAGVGASARQVNTAASAHTQLTRAVNTSTQAHHAHGAAVKVNMASLGEYEHSIRAIIDGLGAGISPMRLFLMEGSRLAQAFATSGGVGGTLKAFGSMVSGLVSPVGLATGAIATMGIVGFNAFNAWQGRLAALQTSLNALGRSTGLTLGGLNAAAMQAAGGRTTPGQALSAFTTMAATGRLSPEIMARLVGQQAGGGEGIVQQLSRVTGTSFAEATTKLADAVAAPTKGFAELNKQFEFLDDNEMQLITHMEASGDLIGAQSRGIEDFAKRIKGAADVTSIWARMWESVATNAGRAADAIGRAVSGGTLEERLAHMEEDDRRRGEPLHPRDQAIRTRMENSLRDRIGRNTLGAAMGAADVEQVRRSGEIGNITRQVIPDIAARLSLQDQRTDLLRAMNTPGALARARVTPNEAAQALAQLNEHLLHFATSVQRVQQDSAASSAAIMATSETERTAILAHKAYNDVIRDGGNAVLAAAEETAKWNEALAETQKALDDETRAVSRRRGVLGMDPLAREIQESRYRHEDFIRLHPTSRPPGGVSALDMQMTALDLAPVDQGYRSIGIAQLRAGQGQRGATWSGVGGAGVGAFGSMYQQSAASAYGIGPGGLAIPGSDINVRALPRAQSGAVQGPPKPQMYGPTQDEASQVLLEDAMRQERILEIQQQSQRSLDDSNRLLDVQRKTWGQTVGQIAEATEKTKLYNEELVYGKDFADSMAVTNARLAGQAGSQAQQQANFQLQTQQVDQVNDMLKSFTSGSLGDVANLFSNATSKEDILGQLDRGQQAKYYTGQMSLNQARMAVAKRQMQQLASKTLINYGIGQITGGLFGTGSVGKGEGGLFGGMLGGLAKGLLGGGETGTFDGNFGAPPTWSYAMGGVHTPLGPRRLPMFPGGGVSNGPAIFGDAGPEAAVPLPDGRSIPVAMKKPRFGGGPASSAAGQQNNVTVHSGDVVVQGSVDERTMPLIQAAIAQNNAVMTKSIVRNLGDIQNRNAALYR